MDRNVNSVMFDVGCSYLAHQLPMRCICVLSILAFILRIKKQLVVFLYSARPTIRLLRKIRLQIHNRDFLLSIKGNKHRVLLFCNPLLNFQRVLKNSMGH